MTKRVAVSDRIVPFTTDDGLELNVTQIIGSSKPTKGPIILVHGAGVRGNIFRAPVKTTIVDALLADGYDVWLENWRASIDLPLTDWTLDQAAFYDHPKAVETVIRETGAESTKAIIHCQGSTSFAMSAMAGLLPKVDTILTNAVSLHPIVPPWSKFKLRFIVPIMARLMRSMNPGWDESAPKGLPRFLSGLVKLSHHECDNMTCRLVSFTYGAGCPALWRHENINDATHDVFIKNEFGHVPLSFFRQIRACAGKGHLVSQVTYGALPTDYAAQAPKTDARWIFFAGEKNLCFTPDSQEKSYEWFSQFQPGRHALHVMSDYSHLDMFMGQNAATDVFPTMIAELNKT